jgi:tetratricopeptide (TPR) repeat protein
VRFGPALVLATLAVAEARAGAQPAQPEASEPSGRGYIGGVVIPLEIDDCKPNDLTRQQIQKQGFEHFDRGSTLYAQGDYQGAVRELVYSYCLVPSFYTILKDIGQAYERDLDYEKAIGYLERYVRAVPPPGTPPCDVCPADPQQDKANVARRVEVLKKLKAKLYVESQPTGAQITIANDAGVAARARAGETIEVLGGHYDMTTELDGYEPHHQAIDVRIGKPYTYFVPLVALKGRLSMQVTPSDARIFLGDRLVGIGHIDLALEANTYVVTSEAADRISDRRRVEVLANQVKRVQVELTAQPQIGRRQLIAFSTAAGAAATASLLYTFQNTQLAGLGSLGGGAAGFVGSMFLLPRDLPLGTSNLTVTATAGGAVLGAGASLLFTRRLEVVYPVLGASAVLGGTIGYLVGDRTRINVGDAALINSGVVWGSVAGALFAQSFDAGHVVGGGLVLSGLGMGTVAGLLLQSNFSITRTHAVLIDVGGLIGIIGGLAAESLVYPPQRTQGSTVLGDARAQEHLANFALGGMAVGLLTAGVLTRNLDDPKVPVVPSLTTATGSDGRATTMYGVTGRW